MVMEVVHEEMGEGTMHCANHPFKNSAAPGGICAFCLQEKLGNLVSSSFPVAIFPSSSSSASPSIRSDFGASSSTASGTDTTGLVGGGSAIQIRSMAASLSVDNHNGGNDCNNRGFISGKSMLSSLLTHEKKKNKDAAVAGADSSGIVFKRSKSIATPRRGVPFFNEHFAEDYCSNRRRFWSFLYLSKHSKRGHAPNPVESSNVKAVVRSGVIRSRAKKGQDAENGSPDEPVLDRKVSRSRSVGCGSRSFSGDFFERISTGFGDCTLRRVESQREGRPKLQPMHSTNGQDCCIKERVKCGGIFSGFMATPSSSHWLSSAGEDGENGRSIFATPASSVGQRLSHGRSRSWAWALASPMRAFGKPGRRDDAGSSKNATPNLDATPSLLAVRS